MTLSQTNGSVGYADIASGISSICRLDMSVDELRDSIAMVADEHSLVLSETEMNWAIDLALANIDARRGYEYRAP